MMAALKVIVRCLLCCPKAVLLLLAFWIPRLVRHWPKVARSEAAQALLEACRQYVRSKQLENDQRQALIENWMAQARNLEARTEIMNQKGDREYLENCRIAHQLKRRMHKAAPRLSRLGGKTPAEARPTLPHTNKRKTKKG